MITGSNMQPNLRRDMTWLCRNEFNNVISSNWQIILCNAYFYQVSTILWGMYHNHRMHFFSFNPTMLDDIISHFAVQI